MFDLVMFNSNITSLQTILNDWCQNIKFKGNILLGAILIQIEW